MFVRWKIVALALPVAFLVACKEQPTAPPQQTHTAPAPSFSAATSGWTEFVFTADSGDGTFYAPCIDDYLDEIGHIEFRVHTVTTDNGSLTTHHVHVLDDFHLRGDRTGTWEPALPNLMYGTYEEHSPGVNGAYEFRDNFNPYFYVNTVSGTKMNFPLKLKVTINANGEVTVDRSVERCDIVGK